MTAKKPKTRDEVIIETWRQTGAEFVGAAELERIQQAIVLKLGEGASESPASIARILAEQGARLRHPEILECDTRWRKGRLFGLFAPDELDFSTLHGALSSVEKINALYLQFELEGDPAGSRQLRELVMQIKRGLKPFYGGRGAEEQTRLVAKEADHWLTIWLQNPAIFPEWLSLRRRSPGFVARFEVE